jgi:hypothetical protein
LTFVHGNLSGSSFKVLDPKAAVAGIDASRTVTRNAPTGLLSPKPEAYFGAKNEAEFGVLPAEDCTVLQGRPNHMFIHPRLFMAMEEPKSARARTLAAEIIDELNDRDDDAEDKQTKKVVEKEKKDVGTLLAFLWVSENNLLTPITVQETPGNPQLNQRCEQVHTKVRRGAVPTIVTGMTNPMLGGPNSDDTAGLAVAAQSLTMVMTSNENIHIREREEDKGSKSLIRNLGPTQQSLFTRLVTEHMREPPEMSDFMKLVLHEKSPAKATQLIVAQMRKWKGTSSGFLSQEANLSESGGMTGFMFFPRSEIASGATAINRDKQRIRDYFDLPVEEECVDYYVKKEYFVLRNAHQLEIVITAWKDLVELCTVENSIAVAGLKQFLSSLDDLYQILEEMFKVVPNFSLLIILSLDLHLQNFYERVSEMKDVATASPYDRGYLQRRADRLVQDLEEHTPPNILIPACLLTPNSRERKGAAKGEEATPSGGGREKKAKAAKPQPVPAPNSEADPAWAIPSGKAYSDFFGRNSLNLFGWPKLADPRHTDYDRRMCCRFQSLGTCKSNCPLALTLKSGRENKDEVTIASKFRKLLHG